MTSRNVVLVVALAFVAASLTWSFAGCALQASGIPPENQGLACTDVAQCDDMNSCTDDACPTDLGHCLHIARADMSDAPAQTPGDCHKIVCNGGREETVLD